MNVEKYLCKTVLSEIKNKKNIKLFKKLQQL